MSDVYTELIVKRKTPMIDTLKKAGLIALFAAAVLAALLTANTIAFIVAVVLGFGVYYLTPRWNLEYEYLYVNGELDIDKIMSKQKRKQVASLNLKEMELLAPARSHYLDSYNNNPKLKVKDFSSMTDSPNVYAIIMPEEGGMSKILFEPNTEILNHIKNIAPRKVRID